MDWQVERNSLHGLVKEEAQVVRGGGSARKGDLRGGKKSDERRKG